MSEMQLRLCLRDFGAARLNFVIWRFGWIGRRRWFVREFVKMCCRWFLRGRVLGNRLGISYYWLPPPPERVKVLAMTGVEVVCNNVFPLKLVLSKICFSCAVSASASL